MSHVFKAGFIKEAESPHMQQRLYSSPLIQGKHFPKAMRNRVAAKFQELFNDISFQKDMKPFLDQETINFKAARIPDAERKAHIVANFLEVRRAVETKRNPKVVMQRLKAYRDKYLPNTDIGPLDEHLNTYKYKPIKRSKDLTPRSIAAALGTTAAVAGIGALLWHRHKKRKELEKKAALNRPPVCRNLSA